MARAVEASAKHPESGRAAAPEPSPIALGRSAGAGVDGGFRAAECVADPAGCDEHRGLFLRSHGRLVGLPWLMFLGFPLASLLSATVSPVHLTLTLIGFGLCIVLYCALLLDRRPWLSRSAARSAVLAMFLLGVALTAYDRAGWASVIVYCAAAMSFRRLFAERVAIALLTSSTLSATTLAVVRGTSLGTAISVAISCIGVGLLLVVIGELRARNLELVRARDEIGRLAVAEERLRFARDLHDLLGHSLSVIALKAELAGRLLERDADAAAVHVHELEQVARTALAEVRDAASGYRQPLLGSELDGARVALEAAGVQLSVQRAEATLPSDVEALLAWTVREGTTNVIRHSAARSCRVSIEPGLASAAAEIRDDGRCPPADGAAGGHGLAGLRERAQRLGGSVEAGPHPDGGFCLRVTVPTARLAAPRVVQQRPATEAHGPTVGAPA